MDQEPVSEAPEMPPGKSEKLEIPKDLTDMQSVMFLKQHIDRPCGITLEDGREVNIKGFYINEARRLLGKMKNPFAKELLEEEIKRYEAENKAPPTGRSRKQ
jgi:hypothetical protein